jgi:ribosomal protein S14
MNDSIEGMGKPRKKVHKINSSSREEQEKAILRNLNMSREELQTTIEKARHQNESIIYK